jgi:hypothetical protein
MADFSASPDAIQAINHQRLVTDWFGHWLSFEDAELTSMVFDRGSQLEAAQAAAGGDPPSLVATFLVLHTKFTRDDPRSRLARVSLKFGDISKLQMSAFGWQNPILGLGLSRISSELGEQRLAVKWGGAAGSGHEVAFGCSMCTVLDVQAA